jgi:hypothetical protein
MFRGILKTDSPVISPGSHQDFRWRRRPPNLRGEAGCRPLPFRRRTRFSLIHALVLAGLASTGLADKQAYLV